MVNKRGAQAATKADLNSMRSDMNLMRSDLDNVKSDLNIVKSDLNIVKSDMNLMRSELKTDISGLKTEVANLQESNRKIAMTVSGLAAEFTGFKIQLRKLDEFDVLKKGVETFMSEIITLRNERVLSGETFREQQATLTDHELRLTRLELRGKQA